MRGKARVMQKVLSYKGRVKKLGGFNRNDVLFDYCKMCGTTEGLVIDHIVPLSRGGMNTIDNIQVLCRSCNCKKANKMMYELDFYDFALSLALKKE